MKKTNYILQKTFKVFRPILSDKFIRNGYDENRVIEMIEIESFNEESDAIEYLSKLTDTYTDYTILPTYQKVADF